MLSGIVLAQRGSSKMNVLPEWRIRAKNGSSAIEVTTAIGKRKNRGSSNIDFCNNSSDSASHNGAAGCVRDI